MLSSAASQGGSPQLVSAGSLGIKRPNERYSYAARIRLIQMFSFFNHTKAIKATPGI